MLHKATHAPEGKARAGGKRGSRRPYLLKQSLLEKAAQEIEALAASTQPSLFHRPGFCVRCEAIRLSKAAVGDLCDYCLEDIAKGKR